MEQTLKVITKRDFPPNLQKKAINSKHIHIYNILRQQGKKKQYYKRCVKLYLHTLNNFISSFVDHVVR